MTENQHSAYVVAKDLARVDPEPMDAELAGYPWLPRMIDKARAAQAGTLGPYYRYPCPIDAACLDLLGLDASTFLEISHAANNNHQVLNALLSRGAGPERLAGFDPVRVNAQLHKSRSDPT
jgi:hypothetical protein